MSKHKIYIDKKESTTLKGIAILLIIWGHIHSLDIIGLNVYHYHLAQFFILPFFYNRTQNLTWDSLKKNLISCFIPYTVFFIFCCIISYIALGTKWQWWEYILGYFNAPGYETKQICGFVFPWFLLCYFFVLLYLSITNKYKWFAVIPILVGCICCVDFQNFTWNILFRNDPFMLIRASYYFLMGTIAVFLFKYIPYFRILGTMLFVILMVLMYKGIMWDNFIYGITGFAFFWQLSYWLKEIRFLNFIGKHSLYIYLTNVFIINALSLFIPYTILGGLIICFLTIIITCLLAIIINKSRTIKLYIFGKT